jgi:hypothetical protein
VRQGRYVAFQLAELAVPRALSGEMPMRHPDRPLLAVTASLYVPINVGLIARAAWG